MSAGPVIKTRYEFTTGSTPNLTELPIVNISVQEETLALTINALTNSAPAGNTNLDVSAKVSKGKREVGIGPRMVVLKFTAAPPSGYTGENVSVPTLTNAFHDGISTGNTGTYLGAAVEVVSKTPQNLR